MFIPQHEISNSQSKEREKAHLVSSQEKNKIVKTDQVTKSLPFHFLKNQSSKNPEFSEDTVLLKV